MLQESDHIKNELVQCLHLMYSELAWVPISLGSQVQPQIILNPDYLPDYFSVPYDYVPNYNSRINKRFSAIFGDGKR